MFVNHLSEYFYVYFDVFFGPDAHALRTILREKLYFISWLSIKLIWYIGHQKTLLFSRRNWTFITMTLGSSRKTSTRSEELDIWYFAKLVINIKPLMVPLHWCILQWWNVPLARLNSAVKSIQNLAICLLGPYCKLWANRESSDFHYSECTSLSK